MYEDLDTAVAPRRGAAYEDLDAAIGGEGAYSDLDIPEPDAGGARRLRPLEETLPPSVLSTVTGMPAPPTAEKMFPVERRPEEVSGLPSITQPTQPDALGKYMGMLQERIGLTTKALQDEAGRKGFLRQLGEKAVGAAGALVSGAAQLFYGARTAGLHNRYVETLKNNPNASDDEILRAVQNVSDADLAQRVLDMPVSDDAKGEMAANIGMLAGIGIPSAAASALAKTPSKIVPLLAGFVHGAERRATAGVSERAIIPELTLGRQGAGTMPATSIEVVGRGAAAGAKAAVPYAAIAAQPHVEPGETPETYGQKKLDQIAKTVGGFATFGAVFAPVAEVLPSAFYDQWRMTPQQFMTEMPGIVAKVADGTATRGEQGLVQAVGAELTARLEGDKEMLARYQEGKAGLGLSARRLKDWVRSIPVIREVLGQGAEFRLGRPPALTAGVPGTLSKPPTMPPEGPTPPPMPTPSVPSGAALAPVQPQPRSGLTVISQMAATFRANMSAERQLAGLDVALPPRVGLIGAPLPPSTEVVPETPLPGRPTQPTQLQTGATARGAEVAPAAPPATGLEESAAGPAIIVPEVTGKEVQRGTLVERPTAEVGAQAERPEGARRLRKGGGVGPGEPGAEAAQEAAPPVVAQEPAGPPAGAGAVAAWQQPVEDYVSRVKDVRRRRLQPVRPADETKIRQAHREAVRTAVKRGEKVPEGVLKGYVAKREKWAVRALLGSATVPNTRSVILSADFANLRGMAKQAKYQSGETVYDSAPNASADDLRTSLLNHRRWFLEASGQEEKAAVSAVTRGKLAVAGRTRRAREDEIDELEALAAKGDLGARMAVMELEGKAETVKLSAIKVGDEFTLGGEKFTVSEEGDTALTVSDGVQFSVPYEADEIVIDKGSLKPAQPEEGPTPTEPGGEQFESLRSELEAATGETYSDEAVEEHVQAAGGWGALAPEAEEQPSLQLERPTREQLAGEAKAKEKKAEVRKRVSKPLAPEKKQEDIVTQDMFERQTLFQPPVPKAKAPGRPPDIGELLTKLPAAVPEKFPNGKWGYGAGKVPVALAYKRADGEPLSEKDAKNIQQFGPGAPGKPFVRRTWDTEDQAKAAMLSLGGREAVLPKKEVAAPAEPPTGQARFDEKALGAAKWIADSMETAERMAGMEGKPPSITKADVATILTDVYGGTMAQGRFSEKYMTDVIEMAVNLRILRGGPRPLQQNTAAGAVEEMRALQSIVDRLPTQTAMTEEAVKFQQYSTPPPLAYLVNWVAKVGERDVVLEPSAGLGGLAAFGQAARAKVIANELSDVRRSMLGGLGIADALYGYNAEHLNAFLDPKITAGEIPRPTVVVMNPPFSSAAKTLKKTSMVAARHVDQALEVLADGGRLVAILGKGRFEDPQIFKKWLADLRQKYNVRALISLSGKGYRKYGTTYDNRIIVVDKTGQTPENGTVEGSVESYEDALPILEGIRNDRGEPSVKPSGVGAPEAGKPEAALAIHAGPPAGKAGRKLRRGLARGPALGERAAGEGLPEHPAPAGEGVGAGRGPEPSAVGVGGAGGGVAAPGRPVGPDVEERGGLELPAGDVIEARELSDGIFSQYSPTKAKVKGSKPHPSKLVESTAMAAVEPPDVSYRPDIPEQIVKDGVLSDAQLEQVIYSGQAHQKMLPDGSRVGHFTGDGTGVGKGRTIAGIYLDNWRHGRRRAVWVTATARLLGDSQRDIAAVFGPAGERTQIVIDASEKAGRAIDGAKDGIAFMTYRGLSGENPGLDADGNLKPPKTHKKTQKPIDSRMHKLLRWLGKDFDGVIFFDEAHLAGNAIEMKGKRGRKHPSKAALATVDLQRLFPKARIEYLSATGATDVTNLSFGDRLGLWGHGTAFADKREFFDKISAGGLSAMEIVAQNLKAMGRYLARSLSFDGVDQSPLTHKLTENQVKMYDEISRAWQMVVQSVEDTLSITGANGDSDARSAARSSLFGAQQRFYNQLLTAMQLPTVIEQMDKDLAAGGSPVLQIVNTNEATQEREIARAAAEEEDLDFEALDLSPKSILMEYVEKSYPTTLYEPETDADGNVRWVEVLDDKGNPVADPKAIEARDDLLMKLKTLKVPENPLENIINHFGANNIAEITGRARRVVSQKNVKGEEEMVPERRSPEKCQIELKQFLDDKRRILIFSEAGGTGASYHAGRAFKNQRRRYHYLLQAGWRADKCVQGMGRTHRADEANQPEYRPVSTDLKGHQRFISTVVRKMAQMGSLVSGERRAAGAGIFDDSYNLENDYAEDAVETLFVDMYARAIEGFDFSETTKKLGYTKKMKDAHGVERVRSLLLDPKTGKLDVSKLPSVTQFLNRILLLEVDEQNRLFDAFLARLTHRIEQAKYEGTFDPGLQLVDAEAVRKVSDEVVFEDPQSTAKTRLIDVDADEKVQVRSWKDVEGSDRYLENVQSGRIYAVTKAPPVTERRTGHVTEAVFLSGVHGRRRKEPEYAIRSEGVDANFKELTTAKAKVAWTREYDKAPKISTRRRTFVAGAFLPIWDRIGIATPMVWRVPVTGTGETFIGVEVPEEMVAGVRSRLQAGAGVQLPAEAVFSSLLERGVSFDLANGWRLVRVKVGGEPRIEIRNFEYGQVKELKDFIGAIVEKRGYDQRIFIPTDPERGVEALRKVLAKAPVVTGEEGAGGPAMVREARAGYGAGYSGPSSLSLRDLKHPTAIGYIDSVGGVKIKWHPKGEWPTHPKEFALPPDYPSAFRIINDTVVWSGFDHPREDWDLLVSGLREKGSPVPVREVSMFDISPQGALGEGSVRKYNSRVVRETAEAQNVPEAKKPEAYKQGELILNTIAGGADRLPVQPVAAAAPAVQPTAEPAFREPEPPPGASRSVWRAWYYGEWQKAFEENRGTVSRVIQDLVRREVKHVDLRGYVVATPDQAAGLFAMMHAPDLVESFRVLYLDSRHAVIEARVLSVGLLDASLVHPREVFGNMPEGTAYLVVGHNHPGGDPSPSADDIRVSRQLVEAGQRVGVDVQDSIIINGKFFSMREAGVASFPAAARKLGRVIPRKEMRPAPAFEAIERRRWEVVSGGLRTVRTPGEADALLAAFIRSGAPESIYALGLNNRNQLTAVTQFDRAATAGWIAETVARESGRSGIKAVVILHPGTTTAETIQFAKNVGEAFRAFDVGLMDVVVRDVDPVSVEAGRAYKSLRESGLMAVHEERMTEEWPGVREGPPPGGPVGREADYGLFAQTVVGSMRRRAEIEKLREEIKEAEKGGKLKALAAARQRLKNLGAGQEPSTISGVVSAAFQAGGEAEKVKGRLMSIEYTVDKAFKEKAKEEGSKEVDFLDRLAKSTRFLRDALSRADPLKHAVMIERFLTDIFGVERYRTMFRSSRYWNQGILDSVERQMKERLNLRYGKAIEKIWELYHKEAGAPGMPLRSRRLNALTPDAKAAMEAWLQSVPLKENAIGREEVNLKRISDVELSDMYHKAIDIIGGSRAAQAMIIQGRKREAQEVAADLVAECERQQPILDAPNASPRNRGVIKNIGVDYFATQEVRAISAFGSGGLGEEVFWNALRAGDTAAKAEEWKAKDELQKVLDAEGITVAKRIDMTATRRPITVGGKVTYWTDAERMAFAALWQREEARYKLLSNGWLPERFRGTGEPIGSSDMMTAYSLADDILKTITAGERRITDKVVDVMTAEKDGINRVTRTLSGVDKATEPRYFGILVERPGAVTDEEMNGYRHQLETLERVGFMRETVPHKNPILIRGIFNVFDEHIAAVSKFIHLTLPVKAVLNALNAKGPQTQKGEGGETVVVEGAPGYLAKTLNRRMGTQYVGRVKQTLRILQGIEEPEVPHGLHWMNTLSGNVAKSVLAAPNLGPYVANRWGGSFLYYSYLWGVSPAVAADFLATSQLSASKLLSRENRRIDDYLMQNGYLRDRWSDDLARIYIPIGPERLSRGIAQKWLLWYRRLQQGSLAHMKHAEKSNAIRAFKALRRHGYSEERIREIIELATRATQNSSSALEDGAFITDVRKSSFGGWFPFMSQVVVARNLVIRDYLAAKGLWDAGRPSGKAWLKLAMTLVGLALATVAQELLFAAWRRDIEGRKRQRKNEGLARALNVVQDVTDTAVPGSRLAMDPLVGAILHRPGFGGPLIERPIENTVRGMVRLVESAFGGKPVTDDQIGNLLVSTAELAGVPSIGPRSLTRMVTGLSQEFVDLETGVRTVQEPAEAVPVAPPPAPEMPRRLRRTIPAPKAPKSLRRGRR